MSTNNRKATSKLSRTQELQKKYPGHKPIPPSTRTVVITLAATVILSLLLVFAFLKKAQTPQAVGNKYVVLETSMGTIKLLLDGDKAPRTVTQFLENVVGGKYDGLTFHRVVKGFMIQGGDLNGNGTGGGAIRFEKTDIGHVRGVISMAASSEAGVTQSDMQFFIMDGDYTNLDGKFAAFGHVVEGMDVVDKIANVPVGENSSMPDEMSVPLTKITIIRATEVAN
ncbi:peptidylprolyl isomerase [Candidatus Cryosericum septentrionale]|jgi:peptidyl-prolyl cis-trans isomerase B (cyclophilin B)|uniref:Peptidyl-prolyl cis-trans isomerase n=1 Tax=Candidatus Cryosericum septentrionale TaxID=2290913 RepID=A0A398DKN5_9BACT|nr:peptidylprolyl isomerase [Candidatus Cryosericum septentrionale]RIE16246.1 peptidylprolyl isomerase [Candidatus Cryosericum septentrionale]